eukprot:874060-Rhodomonas_salina.4
MSDTHIAICYAILGPIGLGYPATQCPALTLDCAIRMKWDSQRRCRRRRGGVGMQLRVLQPTSLCPPHAIPGTDMAYRATSPSCLCTAPSADGYLMSGTDGACRTASCRGWYCVGQRGSEPTCRFTRDPRP